MIRAFQSCSFDTEPGQDRFILIRELFRTLQGYTGVCFDRQRKKQVCVKMAFKQLVRTGKSLGGTKVSEDFLNERDLMAKMSEFKDCPETICKLTDQWETRHSYCYAMEYCEKGSLLDFVNYKLHDERACLGPDSRLASLMRAYPDSLLPDDWEYPRLKVASRLMGQLVDTMAWHHSKGIAHLDLSLENILMKKDDLCDPLIKVIDWGHAREFGDDKGVWWHDKCVGKRKYRAPEVNGKGISFDAKSADIFTLGPILYMIVTGGYPPNSFYECIQRERMYEWIVDNGMACLFTRSAFDLMNRLCLPAKKRIKMNDELRNHSFLKRKRN